MEILNYIALAIGIAGILIIIWGAAICFIDLIKIEFFRRGEENLCRRRENLRHHFGSYLLFGLEFLIAKDIIHTIVSPSLKDLAILGSIVVIRTVISYFLDREMAEAHR